MARSRKEMDEDRITVIHDLPDANHHLLRDRPRIYSSLTIQRAYLSWSHLGQTHDFGVFCEYYNYLEELEESMSSSKRIFSRRNEYNLLSNRPPSTQFQQKYFPQLYPLNLPDAQPPINMITSDDNVFNLKGFNDLSRNSECSNDDLLNINKMIKTYCQTHNKTVRQFFLQYKDYAEKNKVNATVSNIAFYIKYITIKEEKELDKNLSKINWRYFKTPSPVDKVLDDANNNVKDFFKFHRRQAILERQDIYNKYFIAQRVDIINDDENPLKEIFQKYRNVNNTKGNNNKRSQEQIDLEHEMDTVLGEISQLTQKYNDEVKKYRAVTMSKISPPKARKRKTVIEDLFGVTLDVNNKQTQSTESVAINLEKPDIAYEIEDFVMVPCSLENSIDEEVEQNLVIMESGKMVVATSSDQNNSNLQHFATEYKYLSPKTLSHDVPTLMKDAPISNEIEPSIVTNELISQKTQSLSNALEIVESHEVQPSTADSSAKKKSSESGRLPMEIKSSITENSNPFDVAMKQLAQLDMRPLVRMIVPQLHYELENVLFSESDTSTTPDSQSSFEDETSSENEESSYDNEQLSFEKINSSPDEAQSSFEEVYASCVVSSSNEGKPTSEIDLPSNIEWSLSEPDSTVKSSSWESLDCSNLSTDFNILYLRKCSTSMS